MEILKLDFVKTDEGETDLTNPDNLEKIERFVLPVISENVGWGTGEITAEKFKNNSNAYQKAITNSTWDNVHVLLKDNSPVALLEYEKDDLTDGNYESLPILRSILENPESPLWNIADNESKIVEKPKLEDLKNYLYNTPLFHEIGIVVANKFQNSHVGAYEALFDVMKGGILFGWTSNPIIVRLRRKSCKQLLYYPLFGERVDSFEKYAMHLHVVADIVSYNVNQTLSYEFGAIKSEYFVEDRGPEYKQIAVNMFNSGKLSELDYKRVNYSLGFKQVAGAIIGV